MFVSMTSGCAPLTRKALTGKTPTIGIGTAELNMVVSELIGRTCIGPPARVRGRERAETTRRARRRSVRAVAAGVAPAAGRAAVVRVLGPHRGPAREARRRE